MIIQVTSSLHIPEDELRFVASRSSGPGGQNVNKVNTRIELFFDVMNSPSLNEWQQNRILTRLANRIDGEGTLRIVAQNHRTQRANRAESVDRFIALLAQALARPRRRIPTRVPRAVQERRLESKRHRSKLKQNRRWKTEE
jgi:ribosome-associated protein